MSATEILRRMLDERGMEYARNGCEVFFVVNDKPTHIWAIDDEELCASIAGLTPEQAIAATIGNDAKPCYATDYTHARCKYSVNRGWTEDTKFYVPTATPGRGTCRSTTPDDAWCFACSECGKSFPKDELHLAHNHGEINYCPNCGRKVVDE